MDIVFKGLIGASIAVAIHLTLASKHSYLAGLIAAAPIFAIFAHATLASLGRTVELQGAAQFHLFSMVPTGLYLVLIWWLAARFNIWIALVLAATGWAIAAITLIVVWNKGAEAVVNFLNTKFGLAVIIGTLACSLLATASRQFRQGIHMGALRSAFSRHLWQPRYAGRSLAGLFVVVIGSTYLLTSQTETYAGNVGLPGEHHTCALLQSALTHGPGSARSQAIQHNVMANYVALARNARSSGNADLATIYSSRARAMLVGSWIDATEHKVKFC